MAVGIKVPVSVDKTGGAVVVEKDDNDRKTIFLALSDCDNQNAFQQNLGIGSDIVFRINSESSKMHVIAKLKEIFHLFEIQNRYKLIESSIQWKTVEGELSIEFKYRNLESDEVYPFIKTFS